MKSSSSSKSSAVFFTDGAGGMKSSSSSKSSDGLALGCSLTGLGAAGLALSPRWLGLGLLLDRAWRCRFGGCCHGWSRWHEVIVIVKVERWLGLGLLTDGAGGMKSSSSSKSSDGLALGCSLTGLGAAAGGMKSSSSV